MIFIKKRLSIQDVGTALLWCGLYCFVWSFAQIGVMSLLGVFFTLGGAVGEGELERLLNEYIVEALIISNCVSILLFALIAKLRRRSFIDEAHFNKMPPKYILNLIILGISTAYSVSLILSLIPFPESWQELLTKTNEPFNSTPLATQLVATVIMAPLLEEILFRGLIVGTLKRCINPYVAVIIASLAFAFAHGSPFDMESGNPIGFFYSMILGVLMGIIFVRYNSILPSLIFHMAYNLTVSIAESPSKVAVIFCVPITIIEIIIITRYKRGNQQ
ncbi:MAG: CPBP family intramembrane metalloprotease [Clostridia bacterium]|nr:CPBP family intramembrane metalloprotease [Clostridia bacterium]